MNALAGVLAAATMQLIEAANFDPLPDRQDWYEKAYKKLYTVETAAAGVGPAPDGAEWGPRRFTARNYYEHGCTGEKQIQAGLVWAFERLRGAQARLVSTKMIGVLARSHTAAAYLDEDWNRAENRSSLKTAFRDLDVSPRPNFGRELQRRWWDGYKRYALPWHVDYLTRADENRWSQEPLDAWRALLTVNRHKAYDLFWRAVERDAPGVLVQIEKQDVQMIFDQEAP